jgi:hypothetical protein
MNIRVRRAFLAVILIASSFGQAQVNKKAPKVSPAQKAQVAADRKGKPVPPSKDTAAIANAASDALTQLPSPGADYIPCRFTYAELKSLNAPEQVLTLSPADAENLVEKVTLTIQQQQAAGLITPDVALALLAEITKSKLSGLTPSEALQVIIKASLEARKAAASLKPSNDAEDERNNPRPNGATLPPPNTRGTKSNTPANPPAINQAPAAGANQPTQGALPSDQKQKTDTVTSTGKSTPEGKAIVQLNPGTETTQNISPIINSARETIERLSRPPDVGCAMSVLSYNETSKAYGYIIANNYIAVQVVVRNLNRDQQFVLHDVEYSVNADPAGASGRFSSGRDKVVVRALASAEGSFDPRNIVVHGAQGLGALLTTLVPIYGSAIGDASAVYNGGFFPALDKVWKDMSTDQLNLLNDTGFSSSSSSQTVVPKAGTTMLVTFIPSKQFERGWWTQDCVTFTPMGTISNNQIRALEPLTSTSHGTASGPTASIDEALQACAFLAFKKYLASQHKLMKVTKGSKDSDATAVLAKPVVAREDCKSLLDKDPKTLSDDDKASLAECVLPSTLYTSVPKRLFRHWNGNSVSLFEQLSTVVVAGMHIVDEKELQPVLTSIDCTKDSTGKIVFPSPDTGSIICPIKGKNLGKVKSLRLRTPDESGYTDGSVTQASGDDASGTVTFVSAALHALDKADYSVAALSSTNVETATSQFLHFDLLPYVSKTDPTALDMATLKDTSMFVVGGYHLDKVVEVHFYLTDPKAAAVFKVTPDTLPTDRQIKIKLNTAELAKLGKTSADAKWSFILTDSGKEVPVPTTLKYMTAPAPAAAVPAAAGKPVKKPPPPTHK